MHIGISRDFGVNVGGVQDVQGEHRLGEKFSLEEDREAWVYACKDCYRVVWMTCATIFLLFVSVGTICILNYFWIWSRYSLLASVSKNVQFWLAYAWSFDTGQEFLVRSDVIFACSIFHWLSINIITVYFDHDHDIAMLINWLVREFLYLVYKYFSWLSQILQNASLCFFLRLSGEMSCCSNSGADSFLLI